MSLIEQHGRKSGALFSEPESRMRLGHVSSTHHIPAFVGNERSLASFRDHLDRKSDFQGASGLYRNFGKRAFDILICLIALPVVCLVIMLASLLTFRNGPPIYVHRRVGEKGRMFGCFKIRTMGVDSEDQLQHILESDTNAAKEWATSQKLQHDPRVTRIGAILRKTSIDELPQIWNVLLGHMSLVGPRPVVTEELDRYGYGRHAYMSVRPGITGAWQIDARRNQLSYADRVALDVNYAHSYSFLGDLKILAGTVAWMTNPNGV